MAYGEMIMSGPTGLRSAWLFSKPEATKEFTGALRVMGQELPKAKDGATAAAGGVP